MRKIVFFVMCALCSMGMNAQDMTAQEEASKKREINTIKLSEQAVYADVIELATDDNEAVTLAQQKSIQLLQTHVIEIFAKRMNMSKADVQEIWDVIDDKCQNIVVRRGDLLRVFSYIMKDAVGLTPSKPSKKYLDYLEKTKNEEAQSATTVDDDAQPDTAAVKEAAFEFANVITGFKDSINVASEKKEKVIAATGGETATVTVIEEEKKVEPKIGLPNIIEEKKEEVKEPEVKAQEVTVPVICQEMIEQGNYHKLQIYLGKKKAENKLMFGNSRKMQYIERCYIALIDKKTMEITAVLDKGENDRMNFMTKQMDHFKNYKNGQYAAIFVQEY